MPSTPMKNFLYRIALPFSAPNPHKQMKHSTTGQELLHLPYYEHLLVKHRVQGASLLLSAGDKTSCLHTSINNPRHFSTDQTLYRVASITKMATAFVTLSCIDDSLFALDTPVSQLLPAVAHSNILDGITVRHLLSHTSGLQDTPALERSLFDGDTFDAVLASDGICKGQPGTVMAYCNFGFGLLGCILEQALNQDINTIFQTRLFTPLHMRATLDASTLDESKIMPISRVLPYRKGNDVTVTKLGRIPLSSPDPLRHFGHTAGAMYTDAPSLSNLLDLISGHGIFEGKRLISEKLMLEMTRMQASTATRKYGLGLVLLQYPDISEKRLLGHQGFAYGCVDCAFVEEATGRKVVFLNGGASEARTGKLGLVNRDVLRWALRKEMPEWT